MPTGRRRMKPWQKWWCHAPLSKENYVIVIYFAKSIGRRPFCFASVYFSLMSCSVPLTDRYKTFVVFQCGPVSVVMFLCIDSSLCLFKSQILHFIEWFKSFELPATKT